MKNIIELSEANFESEVLRAAGTVLVDFYAPWCGPCKMLAPILEKLAGEFAGKIKIAKLNVDEAPGRAGDYLITGVPTLMLFRDGQMIDRIVGLPSPHALKTVLDKTAGQTVPA